MRLHTTTLRGLGPYGDAVTLDLDAVPGPLIALCGANGEGKTVLLEAGLAGALYRTTPTRGRLADLATTRDAMVESTVTHAGRRLLLRHTLDHHTDKGEALVVDCATDTPLVDSGKRRDFDSWVRANLPTPEVLFASLFGAQGDAGWIGLDPGPRKAVVLRILGHERLEVLSRNAAERARAASSQHDTVVARLTDERQRGGDVAALERQLAAAQHACEVAGTSLAAARQRLDDARTAEADHALQVAAADDARRRHEDLTRQRTALRAQVDELQVRRRNNATLLERAPAIRAAAAELPLVEAQHAEVVAAQQAERLQYSDARAKRDAARDRQTRASTRSRDAAADTGRLAATLSQWATETEAARIELVSLTAAHNEASSRLASVRADLDKANAERLSGKDDRILDLRGALGEMVPSPSWPLPDDVPERAARALAHDDDRAAELDELPNRIDDLDEDVSRWSDEVERAAASIVEQQRHLRTEEQLADLEQQLARAEATHVEASADFDAATLDIEALTEAATAAGARAQEAGQQLDGLAERLSSLRHEARHVGHLDAAEQRIGEYDADVARIDGEIAQLDTAIAAAQLDLVPRVTAPPLSSAVATSDVDLADATLRSGEARVTLASGDLERARASQGRVAELDAERATVEDELADWRLLARDLGRDGIQALELDAAGPELTELANDLLRTCLGTRFSVRVESVRPKADGKGEREGCWVHVHDTERNREGEAKTFSGGERVLIGESLALALALMGCRHAGFEAPTIVRDETAAALSPENGRAYVAMLRRAAELVGASKVVFVSHDPALQELADSRITVAGGRVAT
jgi:exonuclease SbcC